MNDPNRCPNENCGAYGTEELFTEFHSDVVERLKYCPACETEYLVQWGNPIVEVQ